MADIATKAGASRTTVSHVLRGTWRERRITGETYQRIRRIADDIGYRSNFLATSLASQKTKLIGVQFPSFAGEHWLDILRQVEAHVRSHGYRLLLSMPESHRDEKAQIEMLLDHQVDGMILAPLRPRRLWRVYDHLAQHRRPFVFLGNSPGAQYHAVVDDNIDQAKMAANHLISLGHTRIAQVLGPPKNRNVIERHIGYRNALAEAEIPYRRQYVRTGEFSLESARNQVTDLMALPEPPTAVHCLSDEMAIGAIEAVEALGMNVAEDVAVVGYGDDLPYKTFQRIPLTSVRQPREKMAQRSVALLMKLIQEGGGDVQHSKLSGELMVRRSCGGSVE